MPITKVPGYPNYVEVVEDTPIIITVPSTARSLYQNIPQKWVQSYMIRVRSMGTATYIRVGTPAAQLFTLKAVGEIKSFTCMPDQVLDLTNVWIVSDTADAVVEVICAYTPMRPTTTNVQEADDGTVLQ